MGWGWSAIGGAWRRLLRNQRGNISAIMTLTLVPVVGAIGMGAEASNWYVTQRAAQNAADAAAIAAASNGCASTATCYTVDKKASYDQAAKSVAANFGFSNAGDTTVVASNTAPCPSGGSNCYSVTITRKVPFYLLSVLGFDGDTTTAAGAQAQTVVGAAMAQQQPGTGYCVTALGGSTEAIRVNGGSDVHFENCDAYTPSGGSRCNGISGGGAFRTSYMASAPHTNPCPNPTSLTAPWTDTFDDKATWSDPCGGSWPQAFKSGPKKDEPSVAGNKITLASQLTSYKCGDIRLENNITVTSDTTLYIYNGRLDLNGKTLSTSGAAGLTIVFTGTPVSSGGTTYDHSFMSTVTSSTSVLDIAAPKTGSWKGIAVYVDPRLTGSKNDIDFDAAGNKLTMQISGLFYAKYSDITWSGNVTYATSGYKCLAIIVETLLASGSVNASTSQCELAGLDDLPRAYNLMNLVA